MTEFKSACKFMTGLIVFLPLFSCQEEIYIDAPKNYPDKIVVEGRVTNENKAHRLRLTTTLDYFDTNSIKPASISYAYIIEQGSGKIYNLNPEENNPEFYRTDVFKGIVGEHYILNLLFNDEEYSATTYLDTVAVMDSLGYVYKYMSYWGGGYYFIQMTATEPEPAGHIYMFNFFINDTLYNNELRLTSYQNDELFNGMRMENLDIAAIPQEEIKLDTNILRVEMFSISSGEFHFNNAFLSETMGNGSIFSGPPADVPSNVKNKNSNNHGLGYFAASSVVSRQFMLIKQHNEALNNPDYRK